MVKIIERGTKRPKYPWLGRYLCAYCHSVLEITADDAAEVGNSPEEDQRDGWSLTIRCPVCEEVRSLMDCDHVIGRCGELGRNSAGGRCGDQG